MLFITSAGVAVARRPILGLPGLIMLWFGIPMLQAGGFELSLASVGVIVARRPIPGLQGLFPLWFGVPKLHAGRVCAFYYICWGRSFKQADSLPPGPHPIVVWRSYVAYREGLNFLLYPLGSQLHAG